MCPGCRGAALALPWRCPGAALNFLTDKSMQGLQVFFLYCTCLVRGLSPGAALDFLTGSCTYTVLSVFGG